MQIRIPEVVSVKTLPLRTHARTIAVRMGRARIGGRFQDSQMQQTIPSLSMPPVLF
jgi:hypothetical protein